MARAPIRAVDAQARQTSRQGLQKMDIVFRGLYASAPQRLPFAPSLDIRAFLLQRGQGNLLVYSTETLTTAAPAIEKLGGLSCQYLNHWHEAMFGGGQIPSRFAARVLCHENERESVLAYGTVDATFRERHMLDDDFEVIPTPGHTHGATAFLWNSGEHHCLFTSDTIYLREGEWIAAVLEGSSDRRRYIESLELLKGLDFDVLVPWAGTHGQPFHVVTDGANARRRIDAIIDRLRRGDDH